MCPVPLWLRRFYPDTLQNQDRVLLQSRFGVFWCKAREKPSVQREACGSWESESGARERSVVSRRTGPRSGRRKEGDSLTWKSPDTKPVKRTRFEARILFHPARSGQRVTERARAGPVPRPVPAAGDTHGRSNASVSSYLRPLISISMLSCDLRVKQSSTFSGDSSSHNAPQSATGSHQTL